MDSSAEQADQRALLQHMSLDGGMQVVRGDALVELEWPVQDQA
ncbi:hypothetical protein [Lentzea albidocapillata]